MKTLLRFAAVTVVALTTLSSQASPFSTLRAVVGGVVTMDNAAEGNNLRVFGRRANGRLAEGAVVPTGGLASGDGLGNQGGILISRDARGSVRLYTQPRNAPWDRA